MKVLLFGATGCFGTEFETACARRNVTLVGLSHQDIDITDHGAVRRAIAGHAPDAVVNAVALIGINLCEEQPDRSFAVNASAVLPMAKTCAGRGIVLVQASTHAVFDGARIEPYTEADAANPGNIYGISKLASELIAAHQCPKHYVVRFPTMFGRRRNNAPGFVDKMIERLRQGLEVRVADDKIDSPTYALDAADAVLGLLLDRRPYGLYHVANAGEVGYFELIAALKAMLGSTSPLVAAKDADFPTLAPKAQRTAMRSVKLPPLRPWREALQDYVDNGLQAPA
ncbi:NAD(P)-dependent oxidoreductase [Azospirillum sp.]|uniref:SDR family oxidoreductase n=1 Tax=Azospirillum sp. TaxID=34012 RepID=UPI002D621645|nr:NAD(P)-dependent oxidoreductase [Azospirillum sp.]HYD70496.1 NAD(P)-dependent oxidoreductase [Azospirillum sp.]